MIKFGTALEGLDYQAVSGTLTIPAFQQNVSISVPILSDAIKELKEYFYISLSPVSGNVSIIKSLGTASIWDSSDQLVRIPMIVR